MKTEGYLQTRGAHVTRPESYFGGHVLLKDGTDFVIPEDKIEQWEHIYPCDVRKELLKMQEWLISNPRKRKTKRGILRFITNWLSRTKPKREYIPSNTSKFDSFVKSLENK